MNREPMGERSEAVMPEQKRKMCVLDETRECIECGECNRCDLDPSKICDNCMKCLKTTGADYLAIEIDDVLTTENDDEAQ
ncbi:MAG: hypothetical protein PUK86_09805 [bacterium]|nr:hypothetical protein [bacterium]